MRGSRDESLIAAFGQLVVELRVARGMTQDVLATAAGLNRGFVGRVEAGTRQPTLSVITALALALDVAPGDLVREALARSAG